MSESSKPSPLRLAVLISGGGTTLRNLIQRIDAGELAAKISVVISSSADAKGLTYAKEAGIPTEVIERKSFGSVAEFSEAIFDHCRRNDSQIVVMAGFLKLVVIPADLENRVVNIHPSLIPDFCGKGFYGRHVHEAVLKEGAKRTGCTIHFVDNQYDHGPIILQKTVPVLDGDTPDTLARRVFEAECEAYPEAISLIASGRVTLESGYVRIAQETDS